MCTQLSNNFVGSSKGEISTEDCIKKISETINYAHSQTSHAITGNVIIFLEEKQYAVCSIIDTRTRPVLNYKNLQRTSKLCFCAK